jgi:hypothetical protein
VALLHVGCLLLRPVPIIELLNIAGQRLFQKLRGAGIIGPGQGIVDERSSAVPFL